MSQNTTLAALFSQEDAERAEHLEFAREVVRYVDPYMLPPENETEYQGHERNFQSLGAMGCEAITSAMHFSLVTPGFLFFSNDLTPEVAFDPTIPEATRNKERQRLFFEDLAVHAVMEGGIPTDDGYRAATTFHTGIRAAIARTLVMGPALYRVEENGKIRNFRLDNFTTRRDSGGCVQCHVIKECKDPLTLSEEMLEKSGLKREDFEGKFAKWRQKDLYTLVEYQPWTRKWVIRQEMNNNIILEREEKVCSYIAPTIRLQEGESYGRGLFSLWLGDLRTLDSIRSAEIDLAFAASKMLIAIAHGSDTKPTDLEKPSGSTFYANVQGGQVQDIAFLKTEKMADFSIAHQTAETVEKNLGQAMGLFNFMIRDSERTTAVEVQKVTNQAQYITGGGLTWLDETMLRPTIEAYRALCREKNIIKPQSEIDKKFTRTQTLTGIAQVARRAKAQGVIEMAQIAQVLGPEAQQYINAAGSFEAYLRLNGNYIPGTVRSTQEVEQMKQAEAQRQMAVNAAQPIANEAAAFGADVARAQAGLTTQ